MGGGSKGEGDAITIGYEYSMGIHFVLCLGPIDNITEIYFDEKQAFIGENTGGTLSISKNSLYGGKSREGGVSGSIDIEMGGSAQTQNSYLLTNLGVTVPSFRGIVSAIFKSFYMGNNPYMKPIKFRASRIHTRQNGISQWYDSKAAVNEILKLFINDSTLDGNHINLLTNGVTKTINQIMWNPSGLRFYCIFAPSGQSQQIDVSTAFDMNTGTKATQNINLRNIQGAAIGDQGTMDMYGMTWVNNGSQLHSIGTTIGNGKGLFVWSFSVAYDFYSTATYVSFTPVSANFDFQTDSEMFYINGGLKLVLTSQDKIETITMETPYDVSTANNIATANTIRETQSCFYNSNGTVAFFGERNSTTGFRGIRAYAMTVPYDATSINFPTNDFALSDTHISQKDMSTNFSLFVYAMVEGGNYYHTYATFPESLFQWKKGALYSTSDLNPVHIIRECLTDPDWGMAYASSSIDDVTFKSAADILFSEGMGISLLWTREQPIEAFVVEVLRHIDATIYVNRETGKFNFKLIRADYTVGNLTVLNETNISSVESLKRTAFGELVNSVTVNYYNLSFDDIRTVTVQNIAQVQQQGSIIGATLNYPGFTNPTIATKVAQRDLSSLSKISSSMVINANRVPSSINLGDPIKIEWPDLKVNGVFRVLEISLGNSLKGSIRISVIEDIFSFQSNIAVAKASTEWTDTSIAPPDMIDYHITELPYFELVKLYRQVTLDAELESNPNLGALGTGGASPINSMLGADVYANDGSGYLSDGVIAFSPRATLVGDIGLTDTVFSLSSVTNIDKIRIGSYGVINGEFVVFDSITSTTASVQRGILDTLPEVHSSGGSIIFIEDNWGVPSSEYVNGENIGVKLLTRSGSGVFDILTTTTSTTVSVNQRAVRPYNAGNLTVNGSYFPERIPHYAELALRWQHRNRIQQTATIHTGFTASSITPQTGLTYTVRIYGQDDVLLRTASSIATTAYTYSSATEATDTGLGQPSSRLRFELEAVVSGFTSYNVYNHVVRRTLLVKDSKHSHTSEQSNITTP